MSSPFHAAGVQSTILQHLFCSGSQSSLWLLSSHELLHNCYILILKANICSVATTRNTILRQI